MPGQQVVAWNGQQADFDRRKIGGMPNTLCLAVVNGGNRHGPSVFAFPQENIVGMLERFTWLDSHMQSSHGNTHAGLAKVIGHGVGFENLR